MPPSGAWGMGLVDFATRRHPRGLGLVDLAPQRRPSVPSVPSDPSVPRAPSITAIFPWNCYSRLQPF